MASIARRSDGRWRARYRDDAGHEHARHFPRKVDAQAWLDQTTASIVTGMYVDPKAGRITFAQFYAVWSTRQVWTGGTVKAMDLAVGSVPFGEVPMKALRRSHVETWVKSMTVKGLAPGTIRTRVNNVRSVLRGAVRDKVIAADPSQDVPLPRRRRAEASMVIPTTGQVQAILGAAQGPWRAMFTVCALAGLRLGEAAALQVGDVDFLRRTLQVTRQVQRAGGGLVEIRAPKYGGERTVYVPEQMLKVLSLHASGDPGAWIFGVDQPPHQNTVSHQWRKACKAAGVDGVTLHSLRHFYASGLIAQGCDVVTVQRALGHHSATVTLSTYAHLWPNAEDRTRKAAAVLAAAVLAPADSLRTSTHL